MPLPIRLTPANEVDVKKRCIDPLVDFAFKRLLGSESNKDTLIFFLNSILHRSGEYRIVDVTLLNPYNERETADDKLTVVDIKARDQSGHSYQIEVQLVAHRFLAERMVYGWSVLYGSQLQAGQSVAHLRPVSAIWVVRDEMFPHLAAYHHRARFQDPDSGLVLDEDSTIHVLEVEKWARRGVILTRADEWLKFLWEARMTDLETLSETLSPEFAQAVFALRGIRDREADFYKYQARLEFLLDQQLIQRDLELTRQEMEAARQEREAARQEREAAQQQAEAAQQQAEAAQQQAEAAQQQAEAARQQAEAAQQQAEAARQQAEAVRQQAEAARQEMEAVRQQAEAAQQEMEAARQQKAQAQQLLAQEAQAREADRQELERLRRLLQDRQSSGA